MPGVSKFVSYVYMTPIFLALLILLAVAIAASLMHPVEAFSPVAPLTQPDSGLASDPWSVHLKEGEDSWHQPRMSGVQWLSRFVDS